MWLWQTLIKLRTNKINVSDPGDQLNGGMNVLYWSNLPVFQIPKKDLDKERVREGEGGWFVQIYGKLFQIPGSRFFTAFEEKWEKVSFKQHIACIDFSIFKISLIWTINFWNRRWYVYTYLIFVIFLSTYPIFGSIFLHAKARIFITKQISLREDPKKLA